MKPTMKLDPRCLILAALFVSSLGLAGAACRQTPGTGPAPETAKARYQCPMHPTFVSDKPGECRICGMKLVPMDVSPPAGSVLYYRSPMDPSVRSATPAKDSMGMDFVPVYAEDVAPSSAVGGRATVILSPERRQILGLRTEVIRRVPRRRVIRTVGRITVDERRLHHIHTKYEGFVEHLHVDFTGKFVRRGEPLLSIYSPELVATEQEYLLAYRAQKRLGESGIPSVAQGGVDLLEATRQRLLFWDIRPVDILAIEKTGQVMRTLDLYSEISGYVVQKMAFHGMRITPADTLFDVADLSQLWVVADVYESDLPLVRTGMEAEISVPYRPGRKWRGPITYIAPTVDEKTRTIKVRIEVGNEGEELKPDMFADVLLESDLGPGLVVAADAIINAGPRLLVFLDREGGRLEPREVQTGARIGEGFEVLSGLAEGDRVVTSANFLLDSESSLRAALGTLVPGEAAVPAPAARQQ
jgi:Cu(I)/Ag(I) efflux system membrane fusion protein